MSNLRIIGIAAAILIGVPVGCGVINTINTVATAPGRVINKTLQTDNIIFRYERFFALNSEFQSRLPQIAAAKAELEKATDPNERSMLRIDLGAMQQSCRDLANNYNADASKLNASLFRSRNLPTSLDASACN